MWRSAIFAVSVCGQAFAQQTTQVCIIRPEVSGSLDVLFARVSVPGAGSANLGGGETACIPVPPGEVAASAESASLEEPGQQWSSNVARAQLSPGHTLTLYLCPQRRGSDYCCGWLLSQSTCAP